MPSLPWTTPAAGRVSPTLGRLIYRIREAGRHDPPDFPEFTGERERRAFFVFSYFRAFVICLGASFLNHRRLF
jgi:hypothetical protein